MLYQIIWTDDAIEDYHNNINYLLSDWSVKVAQNFIEETEEILDLIVKSPFIFLLQIIKMLERQFLENKSPFFIKSKEIKFT